MDGVYNVRQVDENDSRVFIETNRDFDVKNALVEWHMPGSALVSVVQSNQTLHITISPVEDS